MPPVTFSKKAPTSHMAYINRQFRVKSSISLYRRILRLTSQMTHYDENGVPWRDILRFSARKEFDESRQETDPEVLARALFNAQLAIDDFEEKFLIKQRELEKRQKIAEEVVLGRSDAMSREMAEKILRGDDVEQRVQMTGRPLQSSSSASSDGSSSERSSSSEEGPYAKKNPSSGVLYDAQGNELV